MAHPGSLWVRRDVYHDGVAGEGHMKIEEIARLRPTLQDAIETMRRTGWASIEMPTAMDASYTELAMHARRFFGSELESKRALDIRASDGHRGWVSTDEVGDYADEGARRYEAFDIGRPPEAQDLQHHRLRGDNRWPEGPAGRAMQLAAENVFVELSALADHVADAICANLGVSPDTLKSLRREPVSQLRLIEYFNAPSDDVVIDLTDGADPTEHVVATPDASAAMGAHTDYEFFTFLYQDLPGTQVLDDHGEWVNVAHRGVITLLAGDMLSVFSGGAFQSVLHRAAPEVRSGRISIPFFAGADFHAVVRPVVGTSDENVHFGNHLMQQLRRDFPYLRREMDGIIDLRQADDLRSDFERRALERAQRVASAPQVQDTTS